MRARTTNVNIDTLLQQKQELKKGVPLIEPANPYDILLDEDASVEYLQKIYSSSSMWKKHTDPLRMQIGELLYNAVRPPFDSTEHFLKRYPYDSIKVPWRSFYLIDSVRISLPEKVVDTTHIDSVIPPAPWELMLITGTRTRKLKISVDNLPLTKNDTLSFNDTVYTLISSFIPEAIPHSGHDTTIFFVSDTLPWATLRKNDFPFRRMKYPFMTDSINAAIKTILNHLEDRDSTRITFTGQGRNSTEIWLNSNSDNLRRYWLYDQTGDSASVWIGSPSRNTISLTPEDGVFFKRQGWQNEIVDRKINTLSATDEALRTVKLNKLRPYTWKYRGDISFLFNEGYFANWVSGGNTYISTTMDIKGYLDYINKATGFTWSSTGRLALGMILTDDLEKNLDIIDLASKLNHKAFGKFDFSGQFQFKTQAFVSKKDKKPVSKFFNPATVIIGYGLDYKPSKTLSINISPISYKGIYVPDTALIDQTLYGVDKNRKSKNEMGMYATINSTNTLLKKVTMTNKVQLFSNFLHKPQNIDVEWEMTVATSLNWFADIKINTFLIYDDETLFPATNSKHWPRLDSEGNQIKVPKAQFKELMGVTLAFRF